MSDDEGGRKGGMDDDVSLPKATVQKLIADHLPGDFSSTKEVKELMTQCCVEFIHLISSESNEICEKDSKKTIAPEHVVKALKDLGFESYVEEVESVLDDFKVQMKERDRKHSQNANSGLTQEELLEQQEKLFAASRARYESGGGADGVAASGSAS